jgi:hypothetical protein
VILADYLIKPNTIGIEVFFFDNIKYFSCFLMFLREKFSGIMFVFNPFLFLVVRLLFFFFKQIFFKRKKGKKESQKIYGVIQ